jgi:hypothetical protein
MANETSSVESSLALHEVLESEFCELHGELPGNYPDSPKPETRLEAFCAAVHALKEKRAALCISGGGIRSATFGLGVLQGLARCGLMDKFHYLSTVSGGGYIGSWLSAWIRNDPEGVTSVAKKMTGSTGSTLNPEAEPIRHLREYSNYLAPRTGLTSMDFWTLITTFVRNMFLNWLVLISWLAAAMMVPRLYLAAINLQPDWSGRATWYLWKLSVEKLQPDWNAFWANVRQPWDTGLTVLLATGFILIAVAMAYAIADVPSTGGVRSSQRRFLWCRQLPLLLASVILTAWWAVSRNVHGSELFRPAKLLPWFIGFTVASYLTGGLIASAVLFVRRRFYPDEQVSLPERDRRIRGSVSRLIAILIVTALAGLCLWAIATRMFLDEPKKVQFTRPCEAIKIPSEQTITIQPAAEGTLENIIDGTYIIQTNQGPARISGKGLDLERDPTTNVATKFRARRERKAVLIPTGLKTKISAGTQGAVLGTVEETGYTVKTDYDLVRISPKDVDALRPKEQRFRLACACNATQISNGEKKTLPVGETGRIITFDKTNYTVEDGQAEQFRIARNRINAFDLKPVPAPAKNAVTYVSFAPALILGVLLLVNFLFTGLASWVTSDNDREWWGRSAAWILITMFSWIAVNLIVLWGGQALSPTGNQLAVFLGQVQATPAAKAILRTFGGVAGIAGALLAVRSKLQSLIGRKAGFQWLLIGVAAAFLVLLAIVISWALVVIGSLPWVQHLTALPFAGRQSADSWRGQLFIVFVLTFAVSLFGIVMGFFINANRFSLHATYRNRLIRAYLAASRTQRRPNRFTGFDPEDNFELRTLPPGKPLHIINGALNLVRGEQLARQERKAESFTMSRLHCGSGHVGYRPSDKYGDTISLGTAMAISGAAANPNMGYHSSPIVGFLMTLFNLRLGWWLGNPGTSGAKTWKRSGPGYSVGPLFSEAIGNTNDRYKYVNLSDGGHFENLGLYEMVLRRCHYIVVSDAGEDPKCSFADLGEAVRKIRIDFGVPIEFGPMGIYPRSDDAAQNKQGRNCAIGRICYSVVDGKDAPDGVLVYIKPACYGDEPRDIYEYFKTNLTFPHETTADQFFSESQFESYRMLGAYTIGKLCAGCSGDFRQFVENIFTGHLDAATPPWLEQLFSGQPAQRA